MLGRVAALTVIAVLAGTAPALAATWSPQNPATPGGALGASLRSVSCPAARLCIAVGTSGPAFDPGAALVERWNGSAWAIEPTADPGASNLSLEDVSCSAPDACTAVGFADKAGTGQVALVERWDGRAWTLQDTPAIAGRVYAQLSGVSCPRRRFCEAVGYVSTSTEFRAIAERLDGAAWRLEPTPGPLSGPSQLLGVTCGRRGRCSAVGAVDTSPTGSEVPLAERRTATGWVVERAPLPAGGADGRLWGVSCSGGGSCTAAGLWTTASPGLRPLAERRSR